MVSEHQRLSAGGLGPRLPPSPWQPVEESDCRLSTPYQKLSQQGACSHADPKGKGKWHLLRATSTAKMPLENPAHLSAKFSVAGDKLSGLQFSSSPTLANFLWRSRVFRKGYVPSRALTKGWSEQEGPTLQWLPRSCCFAQASLLSFITLASAQLCSPNVANAVSCWV